MSDPAVCSYITKVLCSQGGRLDYSELPQHLALPEQQLGQILKDAGPKRFLVRKEGGSSWVLAVSAVRVCFRRVCEGCERLHLCKSNLMGKCHLGRACKYSHDILTEANQKVLNTHELSGLNESELRVLLLQNDPFLLPDVCPFYNKGDGNCAQQENCRKLHVCRHFLKGECRFYRCKRSHMMMDEKVLRLLLAEGVDNKAAWNIQTICEHKHAELCKELGQQRAGISNFRPATSGDKRKPCAANQEVFGSKQTYAPSSGASASQVPFPSSHYTAATNEDKKRENSGNKEEFGSKQSLANTTASASTSQVGTSIFFRPATSGDKSKPCAVNKEEFESKQTCNTPSLGASASQVATSSFRPVTSGDPRKPCAANPGEFGSKQTSNALSFLGASTSQVPSSLSHYMAATNEGKKRENSGNKEEFGSKQSLANAIASASASQEMAQRKLHYQTQQEVCRQPKRVSSEAEKKGVATSKSPGPAQMSPLSEVLLYRPRPRVIIKDDFIPEGSNSAAQALGSNVAVTWRVQQQLQPAPLLGLGQAGMNPQHRQPGRNLHVRSQLNVTRPTTPQHDYPIDWDKSELPELGYKAVVVGKTSLEYGKIETLFRKTMKTYIIHTIRRIQNPFLWKVFQRQKTQMKKKNGGQSVDERQLFHGTRSSLLDAICEQNFNWRICGTNRTDYGKGSYFARDARDSHLHCRSPTNLKTMFVARVLVGDFTRGSPTYVCPPVKSADMMNCYDSCVDNMLSPTIFVIFEKHQIYPEYMIEYSEEKKCMIS